MRLFRAYRIMWIRTRNNHRHNSSRTNQLRVTMAMWHPTDRSHSRMLNLKDRVITKCMITTISPRNLRREWASSNLWAKTHNRPSRTMAKEAASPASSQLLKTLASKAANSNRARLPIWESGKCTARTPDHHSFQITSKTTMSRKTYFRTSKTNLEIPTSTWDSLALSIQTPS